MCFVTESATSTQEATFSFVDLAGFTAMTEAHGDAQAVSIVRAFRDRAIKVLRPGDELVKTIGDAVMLRFVDPAGAVLSLLELFEGEFVVDDAVLLPRAGAHHGPAVAVDRDYYGAAVNLAARVAGEARGGQLLVTDRVAMAARDLGAIVSHHGSITLRNQSRLGRRLRRPSLDCLRPCGCRPCLSDACADNGRVCPVSGLDRTPLLLLRASLRCPIRRSSGDLSGPPASSLSLILAPRRVGGPLHASGEDLDRMLLRCGVGLAGDPASSGA
jgi:hypothetical protein